MKKVVLTLCLSLLTSTVLLAQPGRNNSLFNPSDVSNSDHAEDQIEVVSLQSDGKLIIGGWFSAYDEIPAHGIARLDAEGNLDPSFNTGSGISGIVFDVAIQPDDKILVGGSFYSYNGTACANIIRLLPDGAIDNSFQTSSGFNSFINQMALQPDGKIVVAGNFIEHGGVTRNRIARLNSDGSLDLSFNPGTGADDEIHALAIQTDAKILIGGDFTTFAGNAMSRIARLNTNGTIDATFNPAQGANETVQAITLQADGKILIGGRFSTVGLTTVSQIARLNANGTIDPVFKTGQITYSSSVGCIVIDQNAKILLGGYFQGGVARLNTDGSIDNSLDPGTGTTDLWDYSGGLVSSIVLRQDGQIVIAGANRYFNGIRCGNISWIKQDGKLDGTSLQTTGANDSIFAISSAPDGKLLIGGGFTIYNDVLRKGLARINQDGTIDQTFNPVIDDKFFVVKSIHPQTDGKILVGGIFRTKDGYFRPLHRFNADGTLDAAFDNVQGYVIEALAIQPDGKIITGGDLISHPGNIVRLLPDGSLDPSWNVPFGFDGKVHTVSLQSDGKIIVGGTFYHYQTGPSTWVSRNNIARLNADGTLDPTFDPGTGADFTVLTTAVQSDKKIILGGLFQNYKGVTQNGLVRLHPNGTIDDTFLTEVSPYAMISKVVLASDGKIIITGDFYTVNGATRRGIARLRLDGTLDLTFDPGAGANDVIYDASEANDNIFIGGTFTRFDGNVRTRIAKLWSKGPQTISFDVIPNVLAASGAFEIHAFSTSGLPVSFTTSDPEISLSGNLATPLSAGSVTIVANQIGDETYSAADPMQRIFCVNPVKPTLIIDSTEPIDIKLAASSDSHNQWFKDGSLIDGATAKVFRPVVAGVYTVQVSIEGCSSSHSDGYPLLTTSTESLRADMKPLAYPNPTSGKFISFSLEENVPASITISDVRGVEVLAINNYASKEPLSIEGLSQGIYFALIETNNQRYWLRFTKTN